MTQTNTKTKIDISNDTGHEQELLGTFVGNHVLLCESSLVTELLRTEFYSYDDIVSMTYSDEQLKDLGYRTAEEIENARDSGNDMQEIYEWWVCDEWLTEKLEEFGEPILKTDYHDYWGRTTSGQAILLDSVILNIYNKYIVLR